MIVPSKDQEVYKQYSVSSAHTITSELYADSQNAPPRILTGRRARTNTIQSDNFSHQSKTIEL